ncbi:MAG: hypothetical protein IJU15_08925 [Synergistaceae bacterium]|nr:hypothetical protein [Synergistaceae bacterium]
MLDKIRIFVMVVLKKFSRAQTNHALELLQNHSYTQVSAMTGICSTTLYRAKK